MGGIWSEDNKYKQWLEVELAASEALAEQGVVPADAAALLRQHAGCTAKRIDEIERDVKHDVIAFTTTVAEAMQAAGHGDASRWFHYGLTSNDVVDTAQALQTRQSAALIRQQLVKLAEVLKRRAFEFKDAVQIGRTHGVHAEPITFGWKIALYYDEVIRNIERLDLAAEQIRYGKISGAVGVFAHIGPDAEARICEKLGLKPAPIASQVISRDRHASFISALGLICALLEKIALEVRHLQRTEVREAEEPFENIALWHERDISHSSVERVVLADSCILTDYLLAKTIWLVDGMRVYPQRMLRNLEMTKGLVFSGQLLLDLAAAGMLREEAYKLVQKYAMEAWETEGDFRASIEADARIAGILGSAGIGKAFSLERQLSNIDVIFGRVFGQ
jgi:adenylosuccinate lyase